MMHPEIVDPRSRPLGKGDGSPLTDLSRPAARRTRLIDVLAFSNALPALIGTLSSLAVAGALGLGNAADQGRWALMTGLGAFVVYGLDRLRDTARDDRTSPIRTRFVVENIRELTGAIAAAAAILLALLAVSPYPSTLLCVVIGALGLVHRRIKHWVLVKTAYVSIAWVLACIGLPWLESARPLLSVMSVSWILLTSIAANVMASNLRDGEGWLAVGRPGRALLVARSIASLGVLIALLDPSAPSSLVWIPLAESIALAFYRPSEHYGEFVVDGALALGAAASLMHMSLA